MGYASLRWATLCVIMFTAGCGSLLPRTRLDVKSPWSSFDEAKLAFDTVIPNQTSGKDLPAIGFDPFAGTNIRILTYLDVMNRFMPNPSIQKENLDPAIQNCIEVQERCRAYEFEPKAISSKRYGNVLLDILNFRRKTVDTGWQFNALIVLIDDSVVYKLWGGRPHIEERKDVVNPLGPLQDPASAVVGIAFQ